MTYNSNPKSFDPYAPGRDVFKRYTMYRAGILPIRRQHHLRADFRSNPKLPSAACRGLANPELTRRTSPRRCGVVQLAGK